MRRAQRHAHASAGLAVARQREVEAEMEERKRAERAVRERAQQTQCELEDMRRLQVLSHRLAQTVDMRSLLDQVLDAAIAVTRAERGNLHLIDLQSGALKVHRATRISGTVRGSVRRASPRTGRFRRSGATWR